MSTPTDEWVTMDFLTLIPFIEFTWTISIDFAHDNTLCSIDLHI